MITRKQKEEAIKKLKEKFGASGFVAFLNFHGLSVAKGMGLRRALKKTGADYLVSKKTLLGVAAKDAGLSLDKKALEGEVGAVFARGEDEALAASKEVAAFARKNKDMLKIIGGFWSAPKGRDLAYGGQNAWIDAAEIKRLASIPSREVLLTQLAFMLSQPMASLARVLSEVEKKLQVN
ncbi:50S ribosomal protein L10 [Candidatus Giovannonibacteria bacterium RIFCSPLOWO2_01_FULL_44_40]|uniref:Large ribosomal subunit protein uL10 n=1 Tax=Candidatus Giovannonibacteria bacterium RIFCSPHIGHO2_01_FULL_45_23 TaxID=1798325 RepID=A0A1F5VK18_9BACT|nr:MAG: 50S ribosomal protein L10 [Candidatus Giovannonibacteria bacterium RIFCSPHIGHO2_01_FULL_45_23]OGF76440.1 MAG: 50S ribosomal protein L10 [Candidatus Giovannonibacteria bacterium RIFCSPHIGHO2_02_FULL_45_13]OGF80397.1 MAG: 50S ribosomal protein L10 [Candidatus Giovannonibacteria bacterium RIFCSPLOWO2_01_FULL_44_40]